MVKINDTGQGISLPNTAICGNKIYMKKIKNMDFSILLHFSFLFVVFAHLQMSILYFSKSANLGFCIQWNTGKFA